MQEFCPNIALHLWRFFVSNQRKNLSNYALFGEKMPFLILQNYQNKVYIHTINIISSLVIVFCRKVKEFVSNAIARWVPHFVIQKLSSQSNQLIHHNKIQNLNLRWRYSILKVIQEQNKTNFRLNSRLL